MSDLHGVSKKTELSNSMTMKLRKETPKVDFTDDGVNVWPSYVCGTEKRPPGVDNPDLDALIKK